MNKSIDVEFNIQQYPKNVKGLIDRVDSYSPSTAIRYTNVWNKLIKKYGEQNKILTSPDEVLENIVDNIISEYSNNEFRTSTFRQYRAAIIHRLSIILKDQQNSKTKIISLAKISRIFDSLKNVDLINQDAKQPKRSSSAKLKYFPKDLYEHVQNTKNQVFGSKLGVMLKFFLEANINLGLRPIEWLSLRLACDIEKQCLCLVVDNAKNSQGRANGDYRILDIAETDREKLRKQLKIILGFKRLLDIELEKRAKAFLLKRSRETGETYKLYLASKEPDQMVYEYISAATIHEGLTANGINIANDKFATYNTKNSHGSIANGLNSEEGSKDDHQIKLINPINQNLDNLINSNHKNENPHLSAVLLDAVNASVIESYVDQWGNPQYALCQAYMDTLQKKLYRISNEYFKTKKLGLKEDIEMNRLNASIYSTRHQAVANRKKAKWNLDEIAAWFGHASIQTASRHYSRAGRGWGELVSYQPSKQSIELVRIREAIIETQHASMTHHEYIDQAISDSYLDDLF
ncbi:hypothetical protein [Acinetobacter sp. Marseille-Q1618]|uniref:hypothetical protein n=1 Tax=Acinetobacter sp. Marseille-Q1618 TaxID=2697502 RepID=UPI00156DEC05|nr:hypothetical protein [Acinetobacter sp. Marseille-Q1618]